MNSAGGDGEVGGGREKAKATSSQIHRHSGMKYWFPNIIQTYKVEEHLKLSLKL